MVKIFNGQNHPVSRSDCHPSTGGEPATRNSIAIASSKYPHREAQVESVKKPAGQVDDPGFPSCGGVDAKRTGWFAPSHEETVKRHTENFMSLPYNQDLKRLAQKLRRAGNLAEVLLWEQLKNRKFKNYDFDRQKVIGNYIVDFFCTNCNVVIEIDGGSHEYKQEHDIERDEFLTRLGLDIIRIPDRDVRKNMSGVLDMLYDHPALKRPVSMGRLSTDGNNHPVSPAGCHPSTGGEPANAQNCD